MELHAPGYAYLAITIMTLHQGHGEGYVKMFSL